MTCRLNQHDVTGFVVRSAAFQSVLPHLSDGSGARLKPFIVVATRIEFLIFVS